MAPFEHIWVTVKKYLLSADNVYTLVQKVKNKIIEVNDLEIKFRSEKTGRVRSVPVKQFKSIWEVLTSEGYYRSHDHDPYVHSQIISAVLVHSGVAKATYNPLILYPS